MPLTTTASTAPRKRTATPWPDDGDVDAGPLQRRGHGARSPLAAPKMERGTRNKKAVTRAIRRHCHRFKTLTLDNGTEFHDYAVLEERFPVKVYFATPYHSWERGSNENFNGLVRQYLPKGMCMSTVTQTQCDHIADDLNHRPRKRHGFDTPAGAVSSKIISVALAR